MRVLPSVRVLSWLFAAGILVLAASAARTDPPAPQPGAKSAEPAPAVKKEDLRYDGKPFSYWRHYWRTELKAERRIDFVRAMAAFGANGYAEEATTAIIELVRGCGQDAFSSSAKPTPDQMAIEEAIAAVDKIGPRAAPILLRELGSPSVRRFATLVYKGGCRPFTSKELPDLVVPTLVHLVQSKEPEVHSLALGILGNSVSARPDVRAKLLATIKNRATAGPFFSALAPALRGNEELRDYGYAAEILIAAGPAGKDLLPVVIAVLKVEARRCKEEAAEPRFGDPRIPGAAVGIKDKAMKQDRGVPLEMVARSLVEWLGDLGPAAKGATPTLISLAEVVDDEGRAVISKTLGRIGAGSPPR